MMKEEVARLLAMQGYAVPEADLLEITARFNAMAAGVAGLDGLEADEVESWYALFPFASDDER